MTEESIIETPRYIRLKILRLEQEQNRVVREHIISPSATDDDGLTAKQRLKKLDEEIQTLRQKLNSDITD